MTSGWTAWFVVKVPDVVDDVVDATSICCLLLLMICWYVVGILVVCWWDQAC